MSRTRLPINPVLLLLPAAAVAAWVFTHRRSEETVSRFEAVADFDPGHTGQSWGAYWGDPDGDGRPDVLVGNHLSPPTLLLNTVVDGRTHLLPAPSELFDPADYAGVDGHGGQWADFDGDGDDDFLMTVGAERGVGVGANLLLVNEDGVLRNEAADRGLDYLVSRGRAALFFDYDGDGWLDVALTSAVRPDGQAPTALFHQDPETHVFTDASSETGFEAWGASHLASLIDLNGDDRPELLLIRPHRGVLRAYDTGILPFQPLSMRLNRRQMPDVRDLIWADFDGDLRPEAFAVRDPAEPDVHLDDDRHLNVLLIADSSETAVTFTTAGTVEITVAGPNLPDGTRPHTLLHVGAGGRTPEGPTSVVRPEDATGGARPHVPGRDLGIYLSRDPSDNDWWLAFSSPVRSRVDINIASDQPIERVWPVGFVDYEPRAKPGYFELGPDRFRNVAAAAGLGEPLGSVSAAAADFDNDMDVDLFVARKTPVGNVPDVWYENRGDGTFAHHDVLPEDPASVRGVGDGVALADYDLDGSIDILTTNGFGSRPMTAAGAARLYHNIGNGNHWLQLDLEGVRSNRDAIGAVVLLHTPDGRIQYRLEDGGVHNRGQNFKRIHFGMGGNLSADVEVRWPSGIVQWLRGVGPDRILTVTEDGG